MHKKLFYNRLKLLKTAPQISFAGILILLSCLSLCATFHLAETGFSIGSHFISELGHSVDSPLYWVFGIGTVVAGTSTAYLVLAMGTYLNSKLGWLFTIIGVISSLGCVGVGLLPADLYMRPHLYAALTFFWGSLLACIIFSIILFYDKSHGLPKWFVLPTILLVGNTIIFLSLPREQIKTFLLDKAAFVRPSFWFHPFFEWMILFSVIVWLCSINSYLILREKENQLI